MIEPKTLPGFMELLPQDQILFNKIKNIIIKNYENFGFLPLDTPILESSEVLLAKAGGETEKQIYQFQKGENKLCMRFDLTVPLAKYVAANLSELPFPFARYQIGKVYRGEKPQKGRFREFYQCDIDVIGKGYLSLSYDALIPTVIYNIFKELEIGDFTIFLNNRKILIGFLEEIEVRDIQNDVLRLIDKIDKIGKDNFIATLKLDYKLTEEKVNSIINLLDISGTASEQIEKLKAFNIINQKFQNGVNELNEVVKKIKMFGVDEKYFNINLKIVRGLDYYTGTVYETFIKGYENIGSVCSGGRFDNLAEYYTSEKLPGVGMGLGLTRLFYLLKENNLIKNLITSKTKVVIIPLGDTIQNCIQISNKLRELGISNTIYFEEAKLKQKISFANKSGIRYAIFIGEDEMLNNYFTLKDLQKFEQFKLNENELLNTLKNI